MLKKNVKKTAFIIDTNGEIRLSSINPRVWGGTYWSSMFMRAARYPKFNPSLEERKEAKIFYTRLITELPCSLCRVSYKELLQRFPIDEYLDSRKRLITWVWLLRDQVNRKLIVQERREYDDFLKTIPDHISDEEKDKMASAKFIYTKPSPPVERVVQKWMSPP